MIDKQQLQAMGEHQAEQHMCMAKQIEDLQARLQECTIGAAKMQEQRDALAKQVLDLTVSIANSLTDRLDLNGIYTALAGELPVTSVEVTETIRTAPARIWLQVGDQSHYHSEPFPSDTGDVTWCADSVVACEVPYVRADLTGGHHSSLEEWQLVPVEPTPEMVEAYFAGKMEAQSCTHQLRARERVVRDYKAMLAAAPNPGQTK